MGNDTFYEILKRIAPHKERLSFTTLQGWGETLLDKNIVEKVRMAKEMGFPSVGFATIAANLDDELAVKLIRAGLDTIIFSVDGFHKETHEAIRVGTDFSTMIDNVKNFIRRRNELGSTRIIVRMIRQSLNKHEWPLYKNYWSTMLDGKYGDKIGVFDVQYRGQHYTNEMKTAVQDMTSNGYMCPEICERLNVYVDGDVALCCADDVGWFKDLGNLIDEDPLEIYNRSTFSSYRAAMRKGKLTELEHCKTCSMMLGAKNSAYIDVPVCQSN